MYVSFLKCPECTLVFSLPRDVVKDEDVVTCPRCEEEVDTEDDALVFA